MISSRFISSLKNIRKPGTYKCSDKRYKICKTYLNETMNSQFQMVKFGKFAEKLTATQLMSSIISNVYRKRNIYWEKKEAIQRDLKLE